MKSHLKILVYLGLGISLSFLGCKQKLSCADLNLENLGYKEILSSIHQTKFQLSERQSLNSSWMKSAEYYSCDGKAGFFIYETKQGKEYIHQNVEYEVWRGFLEAESHGSFYSKNISSKGKYHFGR